MSYSHLPPLRLLSLDGGGVRGLSSLMILKDLMEGIAEEEKKLCYRVADCSEVLKPCDYFDLIGGTSTGGIIAILLSRLRLDVPTCINIYSRLAEEIFKNDRSVSILGVKFRMANSRFSGAVLEKAIKSVLKEQGFDPEELMWDQTLFEGDKVKCSSSGRTDSTPSSSQNVPRLEVTRTTSDSAAGKETSNGSGSFSFKRSSSALIPSRGRKETGLDIPATHPVGMLKRVPTAKFKNDNGVGCHGLVLAVYKHAIGAGAKIFPTFDPNDKETKIWQALRATSAAPTFFEEIAFGTPKITYIDGGLGFNSPCAEVDFEAKTIWRGREIGCIVSIGTGLQTIPSIDTNGRWFPFGTEVSIAAAVVQMATSTARVDNEVQRMYRDTQTEYYRWDVDQGLGQISLEQWMKEDEMGAVTKQYMTDPDQRIRKSQLAKTMARLSADPKTVECSAGRFRIGLRGEGLQLRDPAYPNIPCWLLEDLDLKTGYPIGMQVPQKQKSQEGEASSARKSLAAGKVLPVEADLDGEGHHSEAQIITCCRADTICLRTLLTAVPQGRYTVKFIVCFFTLDPSSPIDSPQVRNFHNLPKLLTGSSPSSRRSSTSSGGDEKAPATSRHRDSAPPINLIFSAGAPYDPKSFTHRFVDLKISPDVVPVLLHPDAVRVRVDEECWANNQGKGWFEIDGDVEIQVGLGGNVGVVVSMLWKGERCVGGWSFGGVRLVPVGTGLKRGGSKRGTARACT